MMSSTSTSKRQTTCVWYIILLASTLCLSGCAAITPVASVIGATGSVTTAYYAVKMASGEYILVSRDCLWATRLKMSEQGKMGLTREDKEQLAKHNINYEKLCSDQVSE